jgi:hypothetical protein
MQSLKQLLQWGKKTPIWILNSRIGIQRLPQIALMPQFQKTQATLVNPSLTTAMKAVDGEADVKREAVEEGVIGEGVGGAVQMEVDAIREAKRVGRNGGLSFYFVY